MEIKGKCPVQKKEYSINVFYINASTHDRDKSIKGRYICKYSQTVKECFEGAECPIYKSAPDEI